MRTKLIILTIALLALALALLNKISTVVSAQTAVSYNRDIRPIFSDTCFRCHGPDKNSRKAGLRLDLRDEATKKTKSGVTPIVPNRPEESEIVRRIFSKEKFEMMPPEEIHKTLTETQKETIKRWIAEGAKYEGHWAYQPVMRPEDIRFSHPQSPVNNPIDAFIQKRLLLEGLEPAPEADRRTLIRRVSLDLTGIPPTPAEAAAFVNDKTSDAYEKLVDRLLASPRYAEKQTMHWLDAVRYGDTAGFHGDNAMPAWPYRDYVLRAFRNNKPFDEFTREQIAGDLLPSATEPQRVASAYNRMNRVSAEGGLQPKEYLAKYGADRVRTTSVVWFGATMGCAECHDHKFDPYLAKDFYAMKAFFADIKETGLVPDRGRAAFGSKLMLSTEEQRTKLNEYGRLIAWYNSELENKANELKAQQKDWEKQILKKFEAGELAWKFPRPLTASSSGGATMKIYQDEELTTTQYVRGNIETKTIKGDGLIVVSGKTPETDVYTVTVKPGAGEWTAIGLEVVQDESLPGDRLARGGDRFVLTEFEAGMNGQKLNYSLATTDGFGQPIEHPALAAIDGDMKTGWGVQYGDGRNAFLNLRLTNKLKTTAESLVTIRLHQVSNFRKATIGRFKIAMSDTQYSWADYNGSVGAKWLQGVPPDVASGLRTSDATKRSTAQKKAIDDYFKWVQPEFLELNQKIAKLEYDRDLLDAVIPRVVVSEAASTPMETRILPRGNFLDESGEIVTPAIPQMFGKLETNGQRATRLDLANWIVAKENPLTARVFVNRLWRQFFGTGLSKSLEDFGSQGEAPSHPELLDWLASEFMHPINCGTSNADCGVGAHDWDVKHIIRTIVTSHTYRQSSLPRTETPQSALPNPHSADFDNRLLAHQNRFRVDAEIIRDIALSVSGLLVEQFGGPSVKPYQPEGYLLALNFPKRDYAAEYGDKLYRRGLYTHWQRSYLHPSLLAFDAPSREECTVNRVSSNTPLQALVMLNDPTYLEASRVFAQNILKQKTIKIESQIGWAIEKTLGRIGSAEEIKILTDLYNKNLARFQKNSADTSEFIRIGDTPVAKELNAAKLAAMTTVARAILNLHETITRN